MLVYLFCTKRDSYENLCAYQQLSESEKWMRYAGNTARDRGKTAADDANALLETFTAGVSALKPENPALHGGSLPPAYSCYAMKAERGQCGGLSLARFSLVQACRKPFRHLAELNNCAGKITNRQKGVCVYFHYRSFVGTKYIQTYILIH